MQYVFEHRKASLLRAWSRLATAAVFSICACVTAPAVLAQDAAAAPSASAGTSAPAAAVPAPVAAGTAPAPTAAAPSAAGSKAAGPKPAGPKPAATKAAVSKASATAASAATASKASAGTAPLTAEMPGADAASPAGGAAAGTNAAVPANAADAAAQGDAATPPDTRGLDQEVQGLKKDVVDLNRELFVLEEELLFPANTQVAVFVSMDVGDFFALDSVTLKIDQKEVINYLYTPREVEALLKGGVHRLYLGNLKVGKHELVAFFSGKGPNDRDYKRGATLKFEKGIGAKYLELKINDRQRKQQPEFEVKDWE